MATQFLALGETISIDQHFVSGKHRLLVNDEVVFEGKWTKGTPLTAEVGSRVYTVEKRVLSKMSGSFAYDVAIQDGDEVLHSGLYDLTGKQVENEGQAKSVGALHTCTLLGGLIGMVVAGLLLQAGAVVSVMVAASGCGLGFGVGTLLFGSK